MGMTKKIFDNKTIEKKHLNEFLTEISNVNQSRATTFSVILLFLHLLLLYIDFTNWQKGLWHLISYKLLFYSHLFLVITMMLMIVISQVIKRSKQENSKQKLLFSLFFAYFLLFFSAWISGFIDQLLHQQITVLIMSILFIAVVIYLKPLTSLVMYLSSFALFVVGIINSQSNPDILKANIGNCAIILVVGWFLSSILYSMRVQEFVSKKTIEEQKIQLEKTNTELQNTNKMLQESLEALDESHNVIFSLTVALESKDPYTRGHSERVAEYAIQLAQYIGLSDKDQVMLLRAATLHDIGKIGIPDAILNKNGMLSADEWNVMRSHPENGESICSKLNFAKGALPIIRHHHERFDGTGYPDGLKGEQIPYLARIVSIADAVDAITSNRSYRPARSINIALQELERASGSQFDPELVKAFSQLQKIKIADENNRIS